jgi:rhamnulokinase
MTKEVQRACEESGQQVPEGIAEVATVIYNSLARCYAITISELEEQTGTTFDTIHVVGGGAKADYLNRLTAFATGRKVLAGPTEATAIGNLAVQMITAGVFSDLSAARACIRNSFEIKEY